MAEQRLRWTINKDGQGQGGFLSPPGHPDHEYVIEGRRPRAREADVYTGVGSVLSSPDEYPPHVVRMAQRVMDKAELICSDRWVRMVYGYMRTMYVPWTEDDRADKLLRDPLGHMPASRHAAVRVIRRYFPDHEPRVDLIKNPGKGYGSWPCIHCGQRVQYEARADALAVVVPGRRWTYTTTCPNNADGHENEIKIEEEGS